jgi:hypothetical protein
VHYKHCWPADCSSSKDNLTYVLWFVFSFLLNMYMILNNTDRSQCSENVFFHCYIMLGGNGFLVIFVECQ